jgi:hypothetical protein
LAGPVTGGVRDPWREHVIKFRHEFREQTSFEDEDDDEYEDEVPDGVS